jgi:signal transduction histidine kinase
MHQFADIITKLLDSRFNTFHNALYGIVLVALIFAIVAKALNYYKESKQEKFLFFATMFAISAFFEFMHFILLFNNHYIEFMNVFLNKLFQCIGLIGVLFIKDNPKDVKINPLKYLPYFGDFFLILIGEYFITHNYSLPELFPDLLNMIPSFLFMSILCGFAIIKILNKETPLTCFNLGLIFISISSFYVIDFAYYTSFHRHLIHLFRIIGLILLFIGLDTIKTSFQRYNLRLKLILLPNIYMISFYIVFIILGNFLFHLNISNDIYKAFIFFYSICLVTQSILISKLTEPITHIKRWLAQIVPGQKPIPIKLGQNDEISILANNLNRVWETQWEYTQEINRKQTQIQELMYSRDAFIAALSHDLKSPIFAEQKLIESILADKEKVNVENILEYLEEMYQINDEVLRIANNLLTSHHLESDKFQISTEEADINSMISNIANTLKYIAKEENIDLCLNLSPDLPNIHIEKDLIYRVLTNLISNSLKHSKNSNKIKVTTLKTDNEIMVSIQDNGQGIPEETQKDIFKKYPGDKRKVGTGLGLYISKQIIAAHKGKIWFESTENKGTTFYFTIPYKK